MIYAEDCPRCGSQADWTSKRTDKGRKVAIAIRCECRYLKTEIPIAEYMDVARLVEVLETMRDEWHISNEIEKKETCRRMMERVHGEDKEFDKKYAERQEGNDGE